MAIGLLKGYGAVWICGSRLPESPAGLDIQIPESKTEISSLSQRVEQLKSELSRQQINLERLQLSVQQVQLAQREAQERNAPIIGHPLKIFPSMLIEEDVLNLPSMQSSLRCTMHTCFDYSRCSLTSGFPVFFYHPDDHRLSWNQQLEKFVKMSVTEALNMNVHITFEPSVACVYVVLVGQMLHQPDAMNVQSYLQSLAHWKGDGRNHILLNFAHNYNAYDVFFKVNIGRALIVQSTFSPFQYRDSFDIIIPPLFEPETYNHIWERTPSLSPAHRQYFLSFQGEKINRSDTTIMEELKKIQSQSKEDVFLLNFECSKISTKIDRHYCKKVDWCLCDSKSTRIKLLTESTFGLILADSASVLSSISFQIRLYEALMCGSIPVILGGNRAALLPFSEVVDWPRAVILLPEARVTELHFILASFKDADITSLRAQGKILYERYMSTTQLVVNSVLALVRHRVGIPAPAALEEPSPSIFNSSFQPIIAEVATSIDADAEESLGPLEASLPSPHYQRNFTYSWTQHYHMWNDAMDPFTLYPFTPFDPILPAEAKFKGSIFGFRPIGQGAGGAGKEFSESLGGNVPREQFTVVMLTYEREAVLIDSLQRLNNLPFLNKVVVIWNSPKSPSSELRWPQIGVPIEVIKAKRNSLNNRFLPFDCIETEAVLSMDDDAHLRHDEIVFSFRVWRESRDRIVGLPGRFHAWDSKFNSWLYNSNYSCELSMVLTGAAFFHKYYSFLYSFWMPQAIRDKVEEYMNCEDIAMNFLVAHVTRKPPLKVTSRWTFRCPGCPVALSEEDSHFQERHKCINYFSQVYGYTPLLTTQFRADSVLFKTRIPHDKEKCFKFI